MGYTEDCPASRAPGWHLGGLQPREPECPAPGPATPSPGRVAPSGREEEIGLAWPAGRPARPWYSQVCPLTSGALANPGSPGLMGVTGGGLGRCPVEPTLWLGTPEDGSAPPWRAPPRAPCDVEAAQKSRAVRPERVSGRGPPALLAPSPRPPPRRRTPGHTERHGGLVRALLAAGQV